MWCAARTTGAQHTLRAGIVRVDRELFHQIIAQNTNSPNSGKRINFNPGLKPVVFIILMIIVNNQIRLSPGFIQN